MKTDKQKAKAMHTADFIISSVLLLALALTALLQFLRGAEASMVPILAVLLLCLTVNIVFKTLTGRCIDKAFFFFEKVLDAIPFMIHTTDLDMKWLFMNKATMDFLGLDRDQVVGQHCSNWNASICNTERCSAYCLQNGVPVTYFRQNGLDLRVDTNWLMDQNNKQAGFVEVVQDISELVRIQRQSELINEVKEMCDSFVIASAEIADGTQVVAKGAIDQASSIEEVSVAINEITRGTDRNVQLAQEIAQMSKDIWEDAQAGSNHIRKMIQAVEEIANASQSIKKVIRTIDDIAFQTNILALNAAVEAARAGQHGKGFSVVAEEVRNLASKCADAAQDTSVLIENSIGKAEFGADISSNTAEAFDKILVGIRQSIQLIEDIVHSSNENYDAIHRINDSAANVSSVVHQNSSITEQSAAASEEMSNQARALKSIMEVLESHSPSDVPEPIDIGTLETGMAAHLN